MWESVTNFASKELSTFYSSALNLLSPDLVIYALSSTQTLQPPYFYISQTITKMAYTALERTSSLGMLKVYDLPVATEFIFTRTV
jgi:hypothetical protein